MVALVTVYRRKDVFYTRAKAAGYRSRAAFKLLQLAEGGRLFHRGARVVDLGAWPGGWLQVAAQQVGRSGKVIGVDLRPIAPLGERNVTTITGDITDPDTQARVAAACAGKADLVLSDLAPKLTGIRARDEALAQALVRCVLRFASGILRPGGKLVVKLFTSPDLPGTLEPLRTLFDDVRLTRPQATRKESAEVYAVASGFHRRQSRDVERCPARARHACN
ncbi:MAG: RlmE family RNA methyltransferase [Candidatus Binatia bacterium]